MELETNLFGNKDINFSQKKNEEILCSTSRYIWKLKNISANHPSQIENYFLKKKNFLLNDKQLPKESSLLSLLPDPWQMKDIKKAAQRIINAIKNKEQIAIFGDYDVVGTTSCAMLFHFFQEINYPVDIYIPDRILEGYGLNVTGLKKLSQKLFY